MDVRKVPYLTINRYLLLSIGLWPNDSKTLRRIQNSTVAVILFSGLYPQVGALVKYRDNFNVCCKIVMCLMISLVYIIKYFNFSYETEHRLKKTLKWIQTDWETYIKKAEYEILEERGKKGRILVILHLIIIYPVLIAGAVFPYARYGYNCLTYPNRTNLLRTSLVFEYYILDEHKHMHWIVLHANTFYLVGSHAVIVAEMTSLVIVEHACALFELVSYYVNTAIEETIVNRSKTVIRQYIKTIVQVHYRALSFVAYLNDSYLLHYSILLAIGVITLSLNIYIFAEAVMDIHDLEALIMSGMMIICQFCYLLFCTYAGQMVIDVSSHVSIGTYCSRWYLTPVPMQKFLILFLERCLRISRFVSIGLVKPCFELLFSVLSMSMSYFMVLRSLS